MSENCWINMWCPHPLGPLAFNGRWEELCEDKFYYQRDFKQNCSTLFFLPVRPIFLGHIRFAHLRNTFLGRKSSLTHLIIFVTIKLYVTVLLGHPPLSMVIHVFGERIFNGALETVGHSLYIPCTIHLKFAYLIHPSIDETVLIVIMINYILVKILSNVSLNIV